MDDISHKIDLRRQEKNAAGVDLPELNKVIKNIKAVIDKIKEKEQVFVEDKSSFSNKIILLRKKLDDAYNNIRLTKTDKNILKEEFYSRMIDFEKQQLFLRDIEWIRQ